MLGAPRWALGPSLRLTLYAARFGSWTALRGYNVQTCESLGDVTFPAASPLPVGTPGTGFTLLYVQPLSPPRRNPRMNMPDTHKNTQHAHTTPADTQARAHTRSTGSTSAHQHSHTSRLRARRLHTRGRVARFAHRICCMLHATSCMLHGVGPLASYAHDPADAGRTGADGTVPVVAHRCGM